MRTLIFTQMRRSVARLVAAGLAIVISTAFIATAVLVTKAIDRIAHDTLAARYAQADLLVEAISTPLDETSLATIEQTPGVRAVHPTMNLWQRLDAGTESSYVQVTQTSSAPELEPYRLTTGAMPNAPGTIALTEATATRLNAVIGSTVTAPITRVSGGTSDGAESTTEFATFVVSGIMEAPPGIFEQAEPALVSAQGARALVPDGEVSIGDATVLLEPGASSAEVMAALGTRLDGGYATMTIADAVERNINDFLGSAKVFVALIFGFGAIASLIAALVISNTFQVLVAQRTHQLALLRCVGATRRQVRRSVLYEAVTLGVLASLIGVGAGIALAQAALWVAGASDLAVPVPSWVDVDAAAVLVPLACGVATAALASLVPARMATRVSPLAALRPAQIAPVGSRGSRSRIGTATALGLVGGVGLAAVIWISLSLADIHLAFLAMAAGIVCGTLVVVALVVSAVRWLPPAVSWLAHRATPRSPVGQLTAANLRRNPRRTAATSTALLIGVGLVAMMATGAASADATLGRSLDERNPVDIVVGSITDESRDDADPTPPGNLATDLSPATVSAVSQVGGVERASVVRGAVGTVEVPGAVVETPILGQDPAGLAPVARVADLADVQRDGWIDIPLAMARSWAITDGQQVTVTLGDSTRAMPAQVLSEAASRAVTVPRLTESDLLAMVPDAPIAEVWLRIDDAHDASDVASDIMTALSASSEAQTVPVTAAASSRQGYQRVIQTMLTVVLALLGASVVIALIGVANTLSLSVIERRKESAILRAVGLKRSGLRGMLALEGTAIAIAGTLAGLLIGMAMGWAGVTIMLAGTESVRLVVPWTTLGVAVVIAVVAGLASSVLPGLRAANTPPVAALADE